jgi:hypothetical protein
LGRFFTLGSHISDELDKGNGVIQGRVPLLFSYTGGEICPVPVEGVEGGSATSVNKFHNFTIVACVL